jgi:glycosyltransferase involved in cell wall biosynthesis
MQLSILTPAVPSRIKQLDWLCYKISGLIGDLPVEHLVFLDNKRRSVGLKRDALLRIAKGKYVAFVDDDDDVSDDYVSSILDAAEKDVDVITFLQEAKIDGVKATIEFKLGNPNEPFQGTNYANPDNVKRNAWHVCAWRRTLAILSKFPDSNYGEDWQFAGPLCQIAKTEIHIPKILHYYRHNSKTTEAPPINLASDDFRKVSGQ